MFGCTDPGGDRVCVGALTQVERISKVCGVAQGPGAATEMHKERSVLSDVGMSVMSVVGMSDECLGDECGE